MGYQIEQEIKSMLSPAHFITLLGHFKLDESDGKIQTNTYYDTPEKAFKIIGAALRLRTHQTNSEWTFKLKQSTFKSLELTRRLDYPVVSAPESITLDEIGDPVIGDQVKDFIASDEPLLKTVSFQTKRWSIDLPLGEIALDATCFSHGVDYEIELETFDLERGKAYLSELFNTYHIPFRPADKKIARALTLL